jgi:hypothetical protein
MNKLVLLVASAVIVTLALPRIASAAIANNSALKSAIKTTVGVDQADYYRPQYRRRHFPSSGGRPGSKPGRP